MDESNLIVEGVGRHSYHVTLRRRARGIDSSWKIEIKSWTGRVCAGTSEVIYSNSMDSGSVRIERIRELTPEELEDTLIRYGKIEPEIERTPVPQEVNGADVEELDPAAKSN